MFGFILIAALVLDYLLGEPKRAHPLVGFGSLANHLETRFNRHPQQPSSMLSGLFCTLTLIIPVTLMMLWIRNSLTNSDWVYTALVDIVIVYCAIGLKSLNQHIQPIQQALENTDISQARHLVDRVVSRDTDDMNAMQITSAAIETTIENGADAVFSVLFWYAIGGVTMVVIYRFINTLDAMWGYRNSRYEYFGKAAAKLDDVLNYVPARLTALTYGVCGDLKGALKSWQRDAKKLNSPNAGVVMTAGAGALNLKLGGDALYHGSIMRKPTFGGAEQPTASDICRALQLVNISTVTWCSVLLGMTLYNIITLY